MTKASTKRCSRKYDASNNNASFGNFAAFGGLQKHPKQTLGRREFYKVGVLTGNRTIDDTYILIVQERSF